MYRFFKFFLIFCLYLQRSNAFSIWDYFWPNRDAVSKSPLQLSTLPSVPFEIDKHDEAFLQEAVKLIEATTSNLDMCHHRVILKLRKSCQTLNSEELGKLAIMLLNCQFQSEDRVLYECTEIMSLKDCTAYMNSDAYNIYQTMINRAKAICIVVRQEQFRGLTEISVNKLMTSVNEQIAVMNAFSDNQRFLKEVTSNAVDEMAENNVKLLEQQSDLVKLSEQHRIKVQSNLRTLIQERELIRAGQEEVAILLSQLKNKIDQGVNQLQHSSENTKVNHNSLLSDLNALHDSAGKISMKINETTNYMIRQNEIAVEQYKYTLKQLQEINATIFTLASVINNLQTDFDDKFNWVIEKLGGVNNFSTIMIHLCYLLFGMLVLAFIDADKNSRLILITTIPANMFAIIFNFYGLDTISLTITLISLFLCQLLIKLLLQYPIKNFLTMNDNKSKTHSNNKSVNNNNYKIEPKKEVQSSSYSNITKTRTSLLKEKIRSSTPLRHLLQNNENEDENDQDDRRSVTPFNYSLIGRMRCTAFTARGEMCKNAALRDGILCRIHCRKYDE